MSDLKLRRMTKEDAQAIFEIYSDKEAMKYRGSKPMSSLKNALEFIDNQDLNEDNIQTKRKGIALLSSGKFIGSVMYRYNHNKKGECDIGYSIGRQYWGRGLGHKVVSMMLVELSKQADVNLINAWSHEENLASIKILEKLGFKKVKHNESPNVLLYIKPNVTEGK